MSAPVTSSQIDPSSVLPLTGNSNDSSNLFPNLRPIVSPSIPPVNPQPQNQAFSNTSLASLQQSFAPTVQTPSNISNNTAITSSSDMRHPHLNEDLQEPIQSMLIGHKSQAETTDQAINALKNAKIINDKGEICILGHKVSGKMFKAEDGSFDFHITGPCSDNSVKELQNLKDKCIAAFVEAGIPQKEAEQLVRGIIPEAAKPLSPSDLEVLNNGGCIQYCATDKGYVKMVLNPKDEGGLTLTCFSRSSEGTSSEGVSQTIPADVIFEGKEANGYKVEPPTLSNWKQRLEEIKSEDQQKSQLAEKDIWNAVTQYLKHNINGSDFNMTGMRISNRTDGNETLNDGRIESQQNVSPTFQTLDSSNTSSVDVGNSPEPTTDNSSQPTNTQNSLEDDPIENDQNLSTENLQTASNTPNPTTEDSLHATNSAPTENSQNTPAMNFDIKNFTIEQMTNKINTLFQGIQGASISEIKPNFAKIVLLKNDEYFKRARNILANHGIQGEQLQTTLSKLENGRTAVSSNLRALAIGIARLKTKEDYLKIAFPTTEILNAQKQTADAIQVLTKDFIALAKASTTQQ